MIEPFSKEALSQLRTFHGFKYLLNPIVYSKIFDKLKIEQNYPDIQSRLKVLDLYCGPPQQAILFSNRYHPAQHIIMENRKSFTTLINANLDRLSPPLQSSSLDPYNWDSYLKLTDKTHQLTLTTQPRTHMHNEFLLWGNVTDRRMEGLIVQWLKCAGYKNWLQRYGRVRMLLWVPCSTAVKLMAPPGVTARSKISLVRETFTDTKLVAIGGEQHGGAGKFSETMLKEHDPVIFGWEDMVPDKKKQGDDGIVLLDIRPKDHDIDFLLWDYVTKYLMILRRTPFAEAAESLGHGGREYFTEKIGDPEFMKRYPITFTSEEFLKLTQLFDIWPFKPDITMDLYDDNNDVHDL